MSPEAFDAACLALSGATMTVQWGDDRVYKVGGKMFAVLGPDHSFSCKTSDIAFEALTAEGPGKPAPYLARAKWVWFPGLAALPDDEIDGLLTQAHTLVAAKLTRAARAAIGLQHR
jgi:predicted DNA-binding protein (MmcQ/YjbR family)